MPARGVRAFVVALALAGCVPHPIGPARTLHTYEGKAVTTAESAVSAIETVRLAATTASKDSAFGPYLSIVVSDAEGTIDGLQGTFGSIQPPGGAADQIFDDLDRILADCADHVRDVRVAVRRGELQSLSHTAKPLADDRKRLDRFLEEHG